MARGRSTTPRPFPRRADTIVIGGGTAGAAVAGLLAERADESILLLEAGPDYGPFSGGRWPPGILDARALPVSHDWGYDSGAMYAPRVVKFERGRVLGGCSSHNGCAAIWGSRADYDGWAESGNPGWSSADLLPLFRAGSERMRVRIPARDEVTPFQLAALEAAPRAGIPKVADLNDLDQDLGMAPSPANISDGVRWNAAFAFLDPVRARPNLTIAGDTLTDRLLIRQGRVAGVRVIRSGRAREVEAGRVVIAAGTYGSPAILLRSGVGDPRELRPLGINPTIDLPGVGRNLHDHPRIPLLFGGTPELRERMQEFARGRWMPAEQTIAKARSSRCTRGFDLHIYPVGGPNPSVRGSWYWSLDVACLVPRSRGSLRLSSADPAAAPVIDHRYLTDASGEDLRILVDGLELARAISSGPPFASLAGEEVSPGAGIRTRAEIASFIRANVHHYYHPVGTCRMGPAGDRESVVDARGKIHRLENAYVADASIMPVIPRANTNIPALVVGMRIAGFLGEVR